MSLTPEQVITETSYMLERVSAAWIGVSEKEKRMSRGWLAALRGPNGAEIAKLAAPYMLIYGDEPQIYEGTVSEHYGIVFVLKGTDGSEIGVCVDENANKVSADNEPLELTKLDEWLRNHPGCRMRVDFSATPLSIELFSATTEE